ncbi:MAG: lysophospholipid acyltransferase family protein [Rhodocyclaceae bacterium]
MPAKHRLASLLLPRLLQWLGQRSLPTLHRLGGAAGLATYWLATRYRQHLRGNLARALGREPTRKERHRAAKNAGRMMLELPWIWQQPLPRVLSQVLDVEGWEHLEAARAEGRPILALTPHIGCFEITSLYVGEHMPVTILYRPPKQTYVEPLLRAGRAQGAVSLAPADLSGVRRLIRAMRQGEMAGLLPDQAPGKGEGIWSPFFGKPAYTMTLAARLSQVDNAIVLFFWGERFSRRGWRIHVSPPTEAITGSLEERVHAINRNLESLILRCPTQYLWGYNRYKRPAGAEPPPQ